MDPAVSQASAPEHRPGGRARRRLRRLGLGLFFGSVVVNAGLGIAALLSGDFGQTEGKVLTSSLCVTGALLLVLLCEPAWEQRRLRSVPQIGAVTGIAGVALLIAAIWAEPDSAAFPRLVGTLLTVSGGAALASVLALATVPRRFRWAPMTAFVLIGTAVAMLQPVYWWDWSSDWYLRALGIVGIALAAFTVTIPVIHRVSRGAAHEGGLAILTTEVAHCPFCGAGLTASTGVETSCPLCGRRFVVAAAGAPSTETDRISA